MVLLRFLFYFVCSVSQCTYREMVVYQLPNLMVCVGNMPDIMFSPPLKSPGRSWCDEEEEVS